LAFLPVDFFLIREPTGSDHHTREA